MISTRIKTIAAVGAIGLSMFALVGCSSSGEQAASSTTKQSTEGSGSASTQQRPGVSGTIAAAKSGTLQVQDTDSQTAVTYTDTTTITQQVEAAADDVVAGVCITGMSGAMPGASGSGDSGDSGDASASGGSDDTADSALRSVSISAAVDGECSFGRGAGGAGGGMPGGGTPPTDLPEGATPPSDGQAPADGQAPSGGFGGFANGLVTKVSGSTLTVESTTPDGTASEQEFTVDDSTTYTKNESATSSVLEVGSCVVAMGEYSGERLAATSLAVSPAGDDGCNLGFGGRGPGSGQAPGGAAGGTDQGGASS